MNRSFVLGMIVMLSVLVVYSEVKKLVIYWQMSCFSFTLRLGTRLASASFRTWGVTWTENAVPSTVPSKAASVLKTDNPAGQVKDVVQENARGLTPKTCMELVEKLQQVRWNASNNFNLTIICSFRCCNNRCSKWSVINYCSKFCRTNYNCCSSDNQSCRNNSGSIDYFGCNNCCYSNDYQKVCQTEFRSLWSIRRNRRRVWRGRISKKKETRTSTTSKETELASHVFVIIDDWTSKLILEQHCSLPAFHCRVKHLNPFTDQLSNKHFDAHLIK